MWAMARVGIEFGARHRAARANWSGASAYLLAACRAKVRMARRQTRCRSHSKQAGGNNRSDAALIADRHSDRCGVGRAVFTTVLN
jgi:hypothetical protein